MTVICSNCGTKIGDYVERDDGRIWLQVSPTYVIEFSKGECLKCHRLISYYATDKTLKQMFERRNKLIRLEKGE